VLALANILGIVEVVLALVFLLSLQNLVEHVMAVEDLVKRFAADAMELAILEPLSMFPAVFAVAQVHLPQIARNATEMGISM
jgi:hypothetical protein